MRPIKSLLLLILCSIGLVLSISPLAAQGTQTLPEKLKSLDGYQCPNSDFTCLKLKVPLDHTNPGDKRTIEVVFGILPATGNRTGMFVTATGGPGSSGLETADSYARDFDPAIKEHYDLVFFDQRGAKQSGNLECPNALDKFGIGNITTFTDQQGAALENTSRSFAEECVAEIAQEGVPEDTLKFYGTSQAVEDLEAFRTAIGDEKLWLYGESYGTEYAQTYAAAHPEHLAALFLDGTVDLTTPILDFQKEQTQAFNDVLVATLQDCDRNADCSAEVGGNALAFYDDLITELGRRGITYKFPVASGRLEDRVFTKDMLESVASDAIYTQYGRMLFQRAMAAAYQSDFVPLARIFYATNQYSSEGRVPQLGDAADNTLYFVIACADHKIVDGTPEAQATAYLQAGAAVQAAVPRLTGGFYGRLPCAFWPGDAPVTPPQPLVAKGITTFVMGATTDPATPVQNGKRVYSHLDDGYLITAEGGAHVIFNRSNSCPDSIIKDFLVNGKKPSQRETTCEGVIATPYIPLAPSSVRAFDTPLQIMDAVYNEIFYLPDYYYWNGNTLTLASCSAGGVIGFSPSLDDGDQFRLSDCAFFNGFTMTGSGRYKDKVFTLEVRIGGFETGSLTYTKDANGKITVKGQYAEQQIDLSDTRTDSAA
ncbi:MAG: alpha/beta fold hydrolase [Anaerolineaceae bacterium]|nr:alpha/beta fold hydrolase [Anaerolineaceae bacterium]